jgi:hypothetical protein
MRHYLLFLGLALSLHAQINPTATVEGECRDATGAVVPAVTVTLRNERTGVKATSASNDLGVFRFNLVRPGSYTVEAEKPGFQKLARAVTVEAGQKLGVNLQLTVGETTTQVSVIADAPILETGSASLSTTVNQRFLTELPLSGRNAGQLAWLAAGVIQMTNPQPTLGLDNRTALGYFSANGSSYRMNEFLMDGVPNRHYDTAAYLPPADQVQEINIQTNAFDAEYGHGGGAYVNITTRSGGNDLHFALYEFLRNDALNANNFFSNRSGIGKPTLRFNQFGGYASGRIFKNRTFWFFNYEGVRNRTPTTSLFTVPTEAERAGDFSRSLDASGRMIAIFDPFNPVTVNGRVTRTAFPGNRMPASSIDPVSRAFLSKFVPAPNRAGDPNSGTNNVARNISAANDLNNYTVRIDHSIGERHRIFGRQSQSKKFEVQPRLVDAGGDHTVDLVQQSVGLGDTIVFHPTTTLALNAGFTRYSLQGNKPTYDLRSLGFADSFVRSLQQSKLPRIMNTDMVLLGAEGGDRYDNGYQYSASAVASHFRGRHNLKAGFQAQIRQNFSIGSNSPSGSFTFDRAFTQGPDPNTRGSAVGSGIASFLLGTPASGLTTFNVSSDHTTPFYGFFLQDDIRVTSRLTVNIGLRYDLKLPSIERHDNLSRWAFGVPSPIEDAARQAYARNPIPELPLSAFRVTGGLTFATPDNRRAARADRNDWSPRIGLAYRLNDRTVLRAGFGLFYDYWSVGDFGQSGFSSETPMLASLDGVRPQNVLRDPFPSGLQLPPGRSQGMSTLLGTAFQIFQDQDRTPYNERWQFGVQRELFAGTRLEVNYTGSTAQSLYVGNRGAGSNGEMSRTLRFLPQQYLALGARLQATVPNPFAGLIPANLPLGRPTISVQNLLQSYPHVSDLVIRRESSGRSYYHGAQATLTKRYSHGFQVLATYTFQRQIERVQFLNDSDPRPSKAIGFLWAPHRVTMAGVWDLPSKARGPLGHVFNGWQANTIYTFQSGFALLLPDALATGENPGLPNSERTIDRWFNLAAFRPLPAFTLRSLSTRLATLQGHAINNVDLSINKSFRIGEKPTLQLRWEMFNAFNRAQFGAPNLTPTSGAYGRITSQANAPRSMQAGLRFQF